MKRSTTAIALLAALCAGPALPGTAPVLPRVSVIEGDPVLTVLGPDTIASLDDPKFVAASQASFMRGDEPVVGIISGGVAKAYSIWHLDHHEIVNDDIGGRAVAVTW